MKFNCTECGECCRILGKTLAAIENNGPPLIQPYLTELAAEFPYQVDDKGVCEKFVGGHCSVYEDRPDLCNYRKVYERFPDIAESIEQWYQRMAHNCNYHIRIARLPEKFIIDKPYLP